MVSERQIAANRRNAKRSTGPKTEAGKAVQRLNATKHGLTSTIAAVVPAIDDVAEWERHQVAT